MKIPSETSKTSAVTVLEASQQFLCQHSVLCQTSLPYRDPGPDVRVWEKESWFVSLSLEAGRVKNPETGKWVQLGLPFGPKPRLILAHLNTEALKIGSPEINVEDSLTAFVRRIQNYRPNGKEIRTFKEHLNKLSAAIIRIAMQADKRSPQINSNIITTFELFFSEDEGQRVLWPSSIRLSHEYFTSLQNHAVPLDERAIAGLSHSAMALDIYAWLAQRLHRVPRGKPQFIAWTALKDQFGAGYHRIDNFKAVFRKALMQVLAFYQVAKVEGDDHGLTLRNSLPPVKKRLN